MAGASKPPFAFLPEEEFRISNNFFSVAFDTGKGLFNIYRKNGKHFLIGASTSLNTSDNRIQASLEHYKHAATTQTFSDQLGSGKRIVIISKDGTKKIDFEIRISLYDHTEAVTIESICKNVSAGDIHVRSIEPVHVLHGEGGKLYMPGVVKCITNGQMYFDAGSIHSFGQKPLPDSPEGIKNIHFSNNSLPGNQETIHSWWNLGLFSGSDQESIVIGWLENSQCLGHLSLARDTTEEISIVAESLYLPELLLRTGKSVSSNRISLIVGDNPYSSLESYALAVGKVNGARTQSIINGWCSWFYTLTKVSEEEVLANTKFAAAHLKQYGLEYIQIDEGFQRWHGDWQGNDRFPHGLKWLVDQIKANGFKAGIWISPYVIAEQTETFQKHPDWLVRFPDGSLQRVGNWKDPPADENPRRYCLDITNPGAAQWLYDLVHMIVNDWGFEMIKIDFVAWSILSANRFYDPTQSAAQVYRKGMEIMRKAAGDKCHILECGPGAITGGLIDSMRIEWDVNYGFSDAAWDTYFTHHAGSAAAAGKRYYFHKRTWVNDVDHLCTDLLSNEQSQAAATLIAMSGGNMMSGDRLTQLDIRKLEIFRKTLPSYGEAAIPIDLFDNDIPTIYSLHVKKSFAEWTVVGIFNPARTEMKEAKLFMTRLGLDAGKIYLGFDFWKEEFVGEISAEMKVRVNPESVMLLALHEKTGRPQFISSDRHVIQGAIETEAAHWNEERKTFSGNSIGPKGSSHNVYVYIPEAHPWKWGSGYTLYRDYETYSLKLVDSHIIRVHLRFDQSDRIEWEIRYDEFTPGP
jgi:hypothetical protein